MEKVIKEGGKLSEAEMLRCRTRYFLEGLVIGGENFVNEVFVMMRGYFGATRQTGARRMRGVATRAARAASQSQLLPAVGISVQNAGRD